MFSYKINVFVDFVRHDEYMRVTGKYFCQRSQLILAVNTSRRITGRRVHKELGFGRNGCFQLFGGDLEIVFYPSFHENAFPFNQFYNLTIRNPVRSGNDYFVARIYQGDHQRSEEHTSELQSLMRISYAV